MMNESTSNPTDSEISDAASPYQPPAEESTAAQPASGRPLASAGQRFGAFLLDCVVIGIGGSILGFLLGGTILGMIGMGAGVDAGAAPEEAGRSPAGPAFATAPAAGREGRPERPRLEAVAARMKR